MPTTHLQYAKQHPAKNLEQNWELDCSYGVRGLARFRVNVYKDRGTYAACLRALSSKIPNFEKLGLPDVVREMAEKPRGLIFGHRVPPGLAKLQPLPP